MNQITIMDQNKKLVRNIASAIKRRGVTNRFVIGSHPVYCLMRQIAAWNTKFNLDDRSVPFEIVMSVKVENREEFGWKRTGLNCRFWKGICRSK